MAAAGYPKKKGNKEKTDPKYVLDKSRTMEMDTRDPRAKGEGPCGSEHLITQGSNQYGRWWMCEVCNLRTKYIPYEHAGSQDTHVDNPANVQEALERLKNKKTGQWPGTLGRKHVGAMIKIVTEEKKLLTLLENDKPKETEQNPEEDEELMKIARELKKQRDLQRMMDKPETNRRASSRSTSQKRRGRKPPDSEPMITDSEEDYQKVEPTPKVPEEELKEEEKEQVKKEERAKDQAKSSTG